MTRIPGRQGGFLGGGGIRMGCLKVHKDDCSIKHARNVEQVWKWLTMTAVAVLEQCTE